MVHAPRFSSDPRIKAIPAAPAAASRRCINDGGPHATKLLLMSGLYDSLIETLAFCPPRARLMRAAMERAAKAATARILMSGPHETGVGTSCARPLHRVGTFLIVECAEAQPKRCFRIRPLESHSVAGAPRD